MVSNAARSWIGSPEFEPFGGSERQARVEHRRQHVDERHVGDHPREQVRHQVIAPMSSPPALPPCATIRPAAV